MAEQFACPSCGAPLDYDGSGSASMHCPFCNTTVVVPEALRAVRPAAPPMSSAVFRMTVAEVFSIQGRTVATGRIEIGTLHVGDEVRITRLGGVSGKTATVSTVTSAEPFHKVLTEAKAGDTVGVLLKEVTWNDLQMGDVLEE